jgi:hypothetical protein
MVIRVTFRAALVCCLLLVSFPLYGQSKPTKRNQGLVDFALRGVNPSDRDYGECIDEAQRMLIEQTIDRAYFWSNVAAIGLAFLLFVVVVYQQKLLQRREFIAADVITQYRNALSRAQAQVEETTRKNHLLMDQFVASAAPKASAPAENSSPIPQTKSRKPPAQTAVAAAATPTPAPVEAPSPNAKKEPIAREMPVPVETAQVAETPKTAAQIGLFNSEVDLVSRINTLQQQLNTSQERERQLRRQLNDSELRAQKERDKNRSLQA